MGRVYRDKRILYVYIYICISGVRFLPSTVG